MGKLNGYAMCVKYDKDGNDPDLGTFGDVTEASITIDAETIDITNKDNAADANGVPYTFEVVDKVNATLNIKAYCDGENDMTELVIGDKVAWCWGKKSGTAEYSGKGIVTSMNYTGGATGKSTRDITIKSTGAITM